MKAAVGAFVMLLGCGTGESAQPLAVEDSGTASDSASGDTHVEDSADVSSDDALGLDVAMDDGPVDSAVDTADTADTADTMAPSPSFTVPLFIAGSPYFDKGTVIAGGFQMNSSADKVTGTRTLPSGTAWSSWSATLTVAPTLVSCAANLRLLVDSTSVPALIPKDASNPYVVTIKGTLATPKSGAIDIWLTRSPDSSCGPLIVKLSSITFSE